MRWGWVAIGMSGGCADGEGAFVSAYTDEYCTYYLACSDPALAVFDGIDTPEECRARFGPGVSRQAVACKLDARAADACLLAMDGLQCSVEPEDVDEGLPSACADVWQECEPTEERR